jgi:hypothetical protein
MLYVPSSYRSPFILPLAAVCPSVISPSCMLTPAAVRAWRLGQGAAPHQPICLSILELKTFVHFSINTCNIEVHRVVSQQAVLRSLALIHMF